MNTIALTLAVACLLASIGVAAWVWLALSSDGIGDAPRELAGFNGMHLQD